MEEDMLWRANVMEGPCAVARGKDINKRVSKTRDPYRVRNKRPDIKKHAPGLKYCFCSLANGSRGGN
jgi:hypothetical protein